MSIARRGRYDEYRMVLIGKTGAGKSATGNSLLSYHAFESRNAGKAVTKKCETGQRVYNDRNVVVVDTPGLFDLSKEDVKDEITNCVAKVLPGPHVFVLVVQIDRITEEEQKTVDLFVRYFGSDIYKHMIVVFTRMDEVYNNAELTGYVAGIRGKLAETLIKIDYRYIGFDNRNTTGKLPLQVEEFFTCVHKIFNLNDGMYYSNTMLKRADKAFKNHLINKKRAMQRNLEKQRQDDERLSRALYMNEEVQAIEQDMDEVLKSHLKQFVKKKRGFFGKLKDKILRR